MAHIKNKVQSVTFIAILTLLSGCEITIIITRNYSDTYSGQNIKKSNTNESIICYPADTLINKKNGQNG